jgi:Domain of unknown function (DUF4159)
MRTSRRILLTAGFVALSLGFCVAQFRGGGRRFWGDDSGPLVRTEGGELVNEDTVRTARETANHSTDTPNWTNAPGFEQDVFTFTRILYKRGGYGPGWLGWVNDYPDADLNFSFRLQQMTSLKADPDGRVIRLTDPALLEYPFIFLSHPERSGLTDDEIHALGKYLLNGGALMVDDFWSDRSWDSLEELMKRVLPGRRWTELTMEHPIFHCVFDLKGSMKTLQVPTLQRWLRNYDPEDPESFPSAYRGTGSQEMHVRAWLDDKGRIMVIAPCNSDTGDGWEREGENETYFRLFSEPRAYPLGINIVFYLMTH